MKVKVLRRLAPALIASGLLLMLAGGAEQVRPMSDQPARIQRIEKADHLDSQFADMHQYLLQHKACTELGWPDEWPCTRFSPEERVVQD